MQTVLLSMVMMVRRFKPLFLAALMASVAGCASVPDLGARPKIAEPASLATSQSLADARGAWPQDAWWRGFGDPQLDALIDEAFANAPDIRAASARVRAAEALAQQAGAALLPRIGLEASAGGQRQSQNLGIPPQFVPDGVRDVGRIAGTYSFDLDLWGRNRAALAAATSEAQAASVEAEQTRLLLATNIASAYADLATLHAERDVAEEAVRVRAATAELTLRRVQNGLDTRGELRQAEARVPAARADLAALDESIALTRNRIAALLGAGPDRALTIARPRLTPLASALPDRIALDLIGRRPDIVAARLRTEAAASRISQARAAFYPNINLTALIGLQSIGLDKLFEGGSTIANFGPALTLPIFEGGQLRGQYRGARAQFDQAVANYDATLVGALREVSDAATSLRALDIRLAEQKAALVAAEEAARIARLRYEGGLANQLTALAADDQLLVNRRAVADLEARRLVLNVALVRALGGGFQDQTLRVAGKQ